MHRLEEDAGVFCPPEVLRQGLFLETKLTILARLTDWHSQSLSVSVPWGYYRGDRIAAHILTMQWKWVTSQPPTRKPGLDQPQVSTLGALPQLKWVMFQVWDEFPFSLFPLRELAFPSKVQ